MMGRNPPSLKLRQQGQNGNSGSATKKDKKLSANKEKEPKKKAKDYDVYLSSDIAFKALLSARFCAAIWSHISDCDETYNYWEPTHFLVFGKGLQTWEYSPEYALRSYAYLMFHALPAFLYHKVLQPNPLLIFYLIRCLLGLLCAFGEVYFYNGVCREFGVHIGRMWLAFQLLSAGMFISSTAYLPSTFAMYALLGACWAWWMQKYPLAILMIALGTLLGWPFVALLGIPIAFDILFRLRKFRVFIKWSLLSAVSILGPMVAIDSEKYNRLVIAPWNIVKYNIFSNNGPNLYGTEPVSFYFLNGFLNFNFVWVGALICPVLLLLQWFFVPARNKMTLNLPHWVSLSPLYLWLAVFMLQPHKEERFLFPIYPLISLTGAISVDIVQKLFYRVYCLVKTVPHGTHYLDKSLWIMCLAIMASSLLGISRMFALYQNYHAPFDLLMELNRYPSEGRIHPKSIVNVCVGKDWHRYPSSFFLPNTNWNVRFVQSEFNGILPMPYANGVNGTEIVHSYFNDQNKANPEAYFDVTKCHFMLDLDLGIETPLEPIYRKQTDKWILVKALPFLNVRQSHAFFRAFYIPFVSQRYNTFGNFTLLQRIVQMKPKKL